MPSRAIDQGYTRASSVCDSHVFILRMANVNPVPVYFVLIAIRDLKDLQYDVFDLGDGGGEYYCRVWIVD